MPRKRAQKKRGPGRPELPAEIGKTDSLQVRINSQERREIEKRAAAAGLKVSQWVRQRLLG